EKTSIAIRARFGSSQVDGNSCSEAVSERSAASRAAWKLRGAEVGASSSSRRLPETQDHQDGAAVVRQDSEQSLRRESSGERLSVTGREGSAKSKKGRQATGMYRAVPRLAVDSTRCHWLLPPDSLLCRIDPISSRFLARLWLSLSPKLTRGERESESQGGQRCGRPRSYPARLHAGWLSHTLRPKGWLATIPEDELRNLPMPEDLVSEPDRGPRRPNTAAVEKVILRELGCSTSG
ncbi:unnamed protein product, partial [Polarella glacialis]